MQPNMTTTTTIGADVPEYKSIEERFAMLTDEEKEKVILYVEQLKASRYNH